MIFIFWNGSWVWDFLRPDSRKDEKEPELANRRAKAGGQEVVHKEFVAQSQTANHFYREVLDRLRVRTNIKNTKAFPHGDFNSRVFDNTCGSSAPLFTRLELLCLLPFPKIDNWPQRTQFWDIKEHWKNRNRPAEGDSHYLSSSIAMISRKTVSSAVWLPKATTLKGIIWNTTVMFALIIKELDLSDKKWIVGCIYNFGTPSWEQNVYCCF